MGGTRLTGDDAGRVSEWRFTCRTIPIANGLAKIAHDLLSE